MPSNDHVLAESADKARVLTIQAKWLDSRLLWAIAMVLVVAGSLKVQLSRRMSSDVAWLLHASDRLVSGDVFGRDIIETNPPLVCYLMVPPVLAHRAFAVSVRVANIIYVLFLCVCAFLLSRQILGSTIPVHYWWTYPLEFLILATFVVVPDLEFGQREHFLLLGLVPIILLSAARLNGVHLPGWLSVVTGITGGIAIAIKPFFLIPWLLIVFYLLIKLGLKRVLRFPEILIVASVHVTYAAYIVTATPDYLKIAEIAARRYWAFGSGWESRALSQHWLIAIPFLALVAVFWKPIPVLRPLFRLTELSLAGSVLIVVTQQKAFLNHFLPLKATAALMAFLLAVDFSVRSKVRLARGVLAWLILGAAFLSLWRESKILSKAAIDISPFEEIVRNEGRSVPILVLSSNLWPAFPTVNDAEALWTMRFNHLWIIPGCYRVPGQDRSYVVYHHPEQMSPDERFMFNAVVEDFVRNRPKLLFVDSNSHKTAFGNMKFEWIPYFSADARFASVLTEYEKVGARISYDVFRRR